MQEQVDICIVGGGIVGLFCGLELSKAGLSVRIIDKVYIGSSRRNIGEVILQTHDEKMLDFLGFTYRSWNTAADEYGEDLGFDIGGSAFLSLSEKDSVKLAKEAETDKKYGRETVYLNSKAKVDELFKEAKSGPGTKGAKFSCEDGIIDTKKALDDIRKLNIKNGVKIWGSDIVIDFIKEGNRIAGVKTAAGDVCMAKHVILTAGVWSNFLLGKLDLHMPMRPARCHLIEVSPIGRVPRSIIAHSEPTGDIVMKYKKSGRVLISYTGHNDQAQATWKTTEDKEAVNWVLSKMPNMLEGMRYSTVQKVRVVSLAVTPDNRPYVGKPKNYEGLVVALGMNGKSYAYAAGIAKLVQSIVEGKEPAIDISVFDPNRYQQFAKSEKVKVTSSPQQKQEVSMTLGDKPAADPEATMELGEKPADDPEVVMELGEKPQIEETEVTMELGDKPDADPEATMELGEKPDLEEAEITMELGEKPTDDPEVTMELGEKSNIVDEHAELEIDSEEKTGLGKAEKETTMEFGDKPTIKEETADLEIDSAEKTGLGKKEKDAEGHLEHDESREDYEKRMQEKAQKTSLEVDSTERTGLGRESSAKSSAIEHDETREEYDKRIKDKESKTSYETEGDAKTALGKSSQKDSGSFIAPDQETIEEFRDRTKREEAERTSGITHDESREEYEKRVSEKQSHTAFVHEDAPARKVEKSAKNSIDDINIASLEEKTILPDDIELTPAEKARLKVAEQKAAAREKLIKEEEAKLRERQAAAERIKRMKEGR